MFDFISLIEGWHWSLLLVVAPALLLPASIIIGAITRPAYRRKVLAERKAKTGATSAIPSDERDHLPDTVAVLTAWYFFAIAPILALTSLFLTGEWDWPLSELPLLAEIYIVGIIVLIPITVILSLADNDWGTGTFSMFLAWGFVANIAYLFASGTITLPTWAYIILIVVVGVPAIAVALSFAIYRESSDRDRLQGLAVIWAFWTGLIGVVIALVLATGTLLSLLAIPVLLLLAIVFSSGDEGGGGLFLDLPFSITRS